MSKKSSTFAAANKKSTAMKELRTLIIEGERRPTQEEILEAQAFAHTKKCIVELRWFIPHSGWKSRIISEDTNIEELIMAINTAIYSL